jgi:DNA-binding Lrp family transcriptional regulator
MDWEAFEGRCSDRDQKIIRMRRAGWRQTEIASKLGISPPAVNQRLSALESRWHEMSMA